MPSHALDIKQLQEISKDFSLGGIYKLGFIFLFGFIRLKMHSKVKIAMLSNIC